MKKIMIAVLVAVVLVNASNAFAYLDSKAAVEKGLATIYNPDNPFGESLKQ